MFLLFANLENIFSDVQAHIGTQISVFIPRHPDKNVQLKIIFLISQPKHMSVLKRIVSMRWFFDHPKYMFKLIDWGKVLLRQFF